MKAIAFLVLVISVGCASSNKQASAPTPKPTPAPVATPLPARAEVANEETVTCTLGKETRTLEVRKKGEGCVLNYTKEGKSSEVASSNNGTKHCSDVQTKIREKLEKGDFKCR